MIIYNLKQNLKIEQRGTFLLFYKVLLFLLTEDPSHASYLMYGTNPSPLSVGLCSESLSGETSHPASKDTGDAELVFMVKCQKT